MNIVDFLHPKAIKLELESQDKKGVIEELVELLAREKKVKDVNKAVTAVIDREKLGSTGVGQGVAIPHGRTDGVTGLIAAFGISKEGIEFESLDGEPVHFVFLLLSPIDSAGQHLRALAKVSKLFKDKFFRQTIRDAKTTDEVQKIISQEDAY